MSFLSYFPGPPLYYDNQPSSLAPTTAPTTAPATTALPEVGPSGYFLPAISCWNIDLGVSVVNDEDGVHQGISRYAGNHDQPDSMIFQSGVQIGPIDHGDGSRLGHFYSYVPRGDNLSQEIQTGTVRVMAKINRIKLDKNCDLWKPPKELSEGAGKSPSNRVPGGKQFSNSPTKLSVRSVMRRLRETVTVDFLSCMCFIVICHRNESSVSAHNCHEP